MRTNPKLLPPHDKGTPLWIDLERLCRRLEKIPPLIFMHKNKEN